MTSRAVAYHQPTGIVVRRRPSNRQKKSGHNSGRFSSAHRSAHRASPPRAEREKPFPAEQSALDRGTVDQRAPTAGLPSIADKNE